MGLISVALDGSLENLGLKEKYIQQYGNQYIIESPINNKLMDLFNKKCSKNNIVHNNEQIFQFLNTFEEKEKDVQLNLFDYGI